MPDRLVFWGILIRLTTGASWVDIEAILEHRVSDTTLRALAAELGIEPTVFPGGHIGFAENPAGFEPRLRAVLNAGASVRGGA